MKILFCLHTISTMGGIINYTEHLARGLIEQGHKVDIVELVNKTRHRRQPKTYDSKSSETSVFGMMVDQQRGWNFQESNTVLYGDDSLMQQWKERASKYDVILWLTPVPTESNATRGNSAWVELYEVPTKQYVVIHDGNLLDAYPWVKCIERNLYGVIAVHPCAYNSAKELFSVPVELIFNPMPSLKPIITYGRKRDQIVSVNNFKGWKKVHWYIRAIPTLKKYTHEVVGGGIEHCYMKSKDKCKPIYKDNKGRKIWDMALKNGMTYHGFLNESRRDDLLKTSKFLIDCSYSKRYTRSGSHFNRVTAEAIQNSVLPIAVADMVVCPLSPYKPDVNFVALPYDFTPADLQDSLSTFNSKNKWSAAVDSGRAMFAENFDYLSVSAKYVKFFRRQCKTSNITIPDQLAYKINDVMENHFGIKL